MEQNINFQLSGIQIISKSLAPPPRNTSSNPGFHYEVTVEPKIQAKTNSILMFVFVNISNEDKSESFAKFTTVSFFTVENFEEKIKLNDDGKYAIPMPFEMLMRGVSISTTRGIVYSELRGTYLHNAIMPVIMVDQMESIELNEEQLKIVGQ